MQGKITVGGQPPPAGADGAVIFNPTKPGQAKAVVAQIVDANYDSPHTPTGPVRVTFTMQKPTGKTFDNGRGTPSPEMANMIAAKYGTGIDLTISGDKSDQNFDLDPEKK